MSKYLHLEIPKRCHEDWNNMTPEAQGRFCNSCQKTVTDFTNMSDTQLIAFFKNPKPSVCGRFTHEQLERDILIPRKKIPWLKYFFQFALPAFLISLKASSQAGKLKLPAEKIVVQKTSSTLLGDTTIIKKPNITEPICTSRIWLSGIRSSVEVERNMQGMVIDNESRPLPGATVMIKETNNGVVTDTGGRFSLKDVRPGSTIMISYVGYESREITVDNTGKPLNIQLTPQMMGEVVFVGYTVAKKKNKIKRQESCTKPAAPVLSLYANPLKSSTALHIKWQNLEAGNYAIEIYSTAGVLLQSEKLVLEKALQETSVAINQLLAGNYFLRLTNEKTGKHLSQQFIVQE